MTHYGVVSPEIDKVIAVLDDGTGPTEYFKCYVEVVAINKREAKILAIKHPDMKEWVEDARSNNQNPFSGLDVKDLKCNHSMCRCENCLKEFGECENCLKEYDIPD